MTPSPDRVLYVICCGSPAAALVPDLVRRAQSAGWRVCVIASPHGRKFLDVPLLERLTGHPVRSDYKQPDEPDILPRADAVVAFPATFNTLNKWALGISDTLAVGLLCEYTGLRLPVIAVPCVGTSSGLDTHPAFERSLAQLRDDGVHVVYDRATYSRDSDTLPGVVVDHLERITAAATTDSRVVPGRYARPERERRWLVPALPELSQAVEAWLIEDRYLLGTRLRLRRVSPLSGGPPQYKLGQKVRPEPADARLVMHTTMYLTAGEHERLSQLPGADLRKVRHVLVHDGRRFGLDVYEGRHAGLALVEAELPGEDEVTPPACAGAEVTGDERFTGGWLAFAAPEALATVLPQRR